MIGRGGIAAAAALLALLTFTPPASAQQGARAAVLRIDIDGRVPEAGRIQLTEQLGQGLALAGLPAILGENVRMAVRQAAGGSEVCKTDGCLRDIAAALGVEFLVSVSVSAKQRNYVVTMLLYGANGQRLGETTDSCELCGIQDVGEKVRKVAATLALYVPVSVAVVPAALTLESTPPGAAVTVDGVARGNTPVRVDLVPGEHKVTIDAKGYRPITKTITSDAGRGHLISVDLAPLEGRAVPQAVWKPFGWTAIGLGAAAIAGGIVALSMDRKPVTCAPGAMAGACFRRTNALAMGLIGGGATAAVAGGLVLYFSAAPSAAATSTAPLDWSIALGGRF